MNTRFFFPFLPISQVEGTTSVHGSLPPIISSLSLSNITPASGFNLWDYAFSIFPGNYLFVIDQDTDIVTNGYGTHPNDAPPSDRTSLHIQTRGASGNINAQMDLHSPIGTSYASFGVGPCLTQTLSSDEKWDTRLQMSWRYLVGHRVFMTKQSFLYLESDELYFPNERLYRSGNISTSYLIRSSVGLGWYVSDSSGLFLGAWKSLF